MKKKGIDINGWVVIDKPAGMGSTEVVATVKRAFNANKAGHAGTLDPFATGVLPVALGEATKLINWAMDGRKVYEFVVRFGASSTTDDPEGEIKEVDGLLADPSLPPLKRGGVSKDEVLKIIPAFMGRIRQVPPVYSALKVGGKRAYELARQGVEVSMTPREVEIFALELLEVMGGNRARFRVECSKGTYVRTLGKDMAAALGTQGYLVELRRVKCGVFDLKDAIMLESLEKVVYRESHLLPMETCLRDIAVIAVTGEDAAKLKQGQSVSPKNYGKIVGEAVALFEDKLVAIVRIDERKMAAVRVFNLYLVG